MRRVGVAASTDTFVSGALSRMFSMIEETSPFASLAADEIAGFDLFLAIFTGGADDDLAGAAVDEDFDRLRERGPFLNMVVGDELEVGALREDGGFMSIEPSLK